MLTCKEYAAKRKEELKQYISEKDLHPCLFVIQVGDDPASNSYIRGKMRDCEEVGIKCKVKKYPENFTQKQLTNVIYQYNFNDSIHGIIVQLPLPDHINVKEIQESIFSRKDVDGFAVGSKFDPCTPAGVIGYLKAVGYEFEGKDALVIGRSDIVGKPLARMLTDLDCTVTLAHSKTFALDEHISNSDIVFTCIDKIEYFDSHIWDFPINKRRDIIDIGLGVGKDGKLHGNLSQRLVEMIRESQYTGHFCISGTGGVGLLTRVALLENVVKAAELA